MSDLVKTVSQTLLDNAGISDSAVLSAAKAMMKGPIDYADLYFQNCYFESWGLEDSVVKSGSFNIDKGVGIRANAKEKTGFAYSDEISLNAITQASNAAKSIAYSGDKPLSAHKISSSAPITPLYPSLNPLNAMTKTEKMAILEKVDALARARDSRVIQVNASLSGCYEEVLIVNHLGHMAADVRPLVSLHVSVIVEEKDKREQGRSGGGGRAGDYHYYFNEETLKSYAESAVDEAINNLHAKEAPAGAMPVVLGAGWPGILLHEAVGHGLEGDFNRKGVSAFSGLVGQKVAGSGVTVVDNGTIAGRRGSISIDDEGTPSQETVLIENGILKGYLFDNLNARLMNTQSTGNGRRESYAHIPMPRMTNTYMKNGDYHPDEIIKSVDKGLYAVNFSGGQVDITSGKFVFSASEAYMIEKGKITYPVKGAMLIGNGPSVMPLVSMVGNDLALDNGIGVCGKDGQSVPVGVGQPTLKIDEITVGGTQQ